MAGGRFFGICVSVVQRIAPEMLSLAKITQKLDPCFFARKPGFLRCRVFITRKTNIESSRPTQNFPLPAG
jgi:hypothetical protein